MKKLLLVIVLFLVAVVFVSNMSASVVNDHPERAQSSKLGFEDFGNTDLAPIAGVVHP
ncbi:hypothetical protein [Acholeplasma laidlawii]|jgi:hypothetical protein|uniref:Uncharacterized protein n=1 Tax=Acholeplasma laidlawii (strain PG-8A) TaxID=441768 RepID=A9NGJ0_ACHLI|nr:hypothetical protein [Acholeplasma laidlawii]ABX81470.1 hypothetical protein ACL_0856 [Acholeplasma laidlawii PG-8A]MBG0763074.1 hypothetical protein [Acholeplasma laidlawii]NWH09956.1 hypothetical protein [Acholeplasma laidlawii]NWH11346.1 hypothetical protein [Acholeplasma laidlawii]NWH13244.1 hypothetical protein [Acholeplasma laidlawii]